MDVLAPYSHRSVLLQACLDLLAPRDGGVYCDATLGGGGHAEALLQRSAPGGRVIGLDRDPAALAAATQRLAPYGARFTPVHAPFAALPEVLADLGVPALDGLLADLGVSSAQLDQAQRGFSFQRRGPLDMRMDPTQGETAAALIHRLDADQLAAILRDYGEERAARPLARAIKRADDEGRLDDTLALAQVIAAAHPERGGRIDPATRSFQALRIAVNDELRQINALLLAAPACLAPGGRLAFISFHSLEDRLVKLRLRHLSEPPAPQLALLTRKPLLPQDDEIAQNPRARSAKLRGAVRLSREEAR